MEIEPAPTEKRYEKPEGERRGLLIVPGLRVQVIKLRDTTSMGLLGHWRLSAKPPAVQAAPLAALHLAENGSI